MKAAINLLQDTIKKIQKLRNSDYWSKQIPERCPPVLWFGDHNREDLIVTVGLNPSPSEFFKVDNNKEYKYLDEDEQRLYVYTSEGLKNPLDALVLKRVLSSYDHYFKNKPYTRWFGKPNGYRFEFFINQLEASFYGEKTLGCVHIDLFPFVTIDKYSDLDTTKLEEDVFNDTWFKDHFKKLIGYLNPKFIIVSGKRTVTRFNQHYGGTINLQNEFRFNETKYAMYGRSTYDVNSRKIPIIGLSVNLGNPRNFTKDLLIRLSVIVHQISKTDTRETWRQLSFLEQPTSNELLDLALQHEKNHELAQVGDAVLKIAIREYYYEKEKTAKDIQTMDGTLGDNDYLYEVSLKKLKLQNHILSSSGLQQNPNINEAYARTLEAIIGVIYRENGIKPAKKFVEKWIVPHKSS